MNAMQCQIKQEIGSLIHHFSFLFPPGAVVKIHMTSNDSCLTASIEGEFGAAWASIDWSDLLNTNYLVRYEFERNLVLQFAVDEAVPMSKKETINRRHEAISFYFPLFRVPDSSVIA